MSVIPTMRDRFADQEVTVDMLRDLELTGPGGVIIANLHSDTYQLTHARRLDMSARVLVPIYGHGDLAHDLDCYGQDWEEVADALTDTTWDQLDYWTGQAMRTSPLVRTLRRDMALHQMDLTQRPVYSHALDGTALVRDTFALRLDPRITFTTYCAQRHRDSLLMSMDTHDQGHFVTSWTQRITRGGGVPRIVREAPLRAGLYLHNLP